MITLKLKNFRCWKDKTFTFPEIGFVLLNAESGSGKSTILNAIQYVLYGNLQKVCTYGEKHTRVELDINGYRIVRTNIPKRLMVYKDDKEYEDESAQSIIDSVWGKNFNITSYITQKNVVSFLSMSATDKMNYLETLAIDNSQNVNDIKKKIKDNIKVKRDELLKKTGELTVLSEELKTRTLPEVVSFPLEGKYSEIKVKNEEIRWNKTKKKISQLQTKLSETEDTREKYKKIRDEISLLNRDIENIQTEILKNHQRLDLLTPVILPFNIKEENERWNLIKTDMKTKKKTLSQTEDEERNNLENTKQLEVKKRDLEVLKEKEKEMLDEIKQLKYEGDDNLESLYELLEYFDNQSLLIKKKEELSELQTKLNQIKSENTEKITLLENELKNIPESKLKHYTTLLQNSKEHQLLVQKLQQKKSILIPEKDTTSIKERIGEISILLERITQSKKVRKCPSCGVHVRLDKDTLVLSDIIEGDINTLEKELKQEKQSISEELDKITKQNDVSKVLMSEIQTLERDIEKFSDTGDISDIKSKIEQEEANDKKRRDLESELRTVSGRVEEKRCCIKIEALQKEIQKLDTDDYNTDYTRDEVRDEIQREEDKKNRKTVYETKLKQIRKEILQFKLPEVKDTDYKNMIEDLRISIQELSLKDEECSTNQLLISNYQEYIVTKSRYEDDIKELEKRKTMISERIKSLQNEEIDKDYDGIIKEIRNEISVLNETEEKHSENSKKLKIYLEYHRQREEYNSWEAKVNTCKAEEKTLMKELALRERLYTKVIEAETLALYKIINKLNDTINYFLSEFFPNESITVQILPYKETKKDIKASINVDVGYKGVTTDINSLSGGEFDRVTLAFVIAFNNVFGNNLLLLDESISSLGSVLTDNILEVLYENLKDKLVVLVAHNISEGIFDSIITF